MLITLNQLSAKSTAARFSDWLTPIHRTDAKT